MVPVITITTMTAGTTIITMDGMILIHGMIHGMVDATVAADAAEDAVTAVPATTAVQTTTQSIPMAHTTKARHKIRMPASEIPTVRAVCV